MNITIGQMLIELEQMGIPFVFHGTPQEEITGFSDPGEYRPHTAIWLGGIQYLQLHGEMQYSDVALLFCREGMEGAEQFPNRIYCADPRNTFMELVERLQPDALPDYGIAATAVISPKATLGKNVVIGHHSVVEDNVTIGDDTYIGCGVVIHANTVIGAHCAIYDNTVIGAAGFGFRKLSDGSHKRLPHLGKVIIGDFVEIGTCCNVDRGTFKDTILRDGVKIDSHTLVGHNVEIGENCLIIGGTVGGNCKIGESCEMIGAKLKNRLQIGDHVRIGIGSVVLQNLPDHTECFGNPARIIKK